MSILMSNTYRSVDYSSYDKEHWERFGIKSEKHLCKDRNYSYKLAYRPDRWFRYDGRGALYRREQELDREFKNEIFSTES